MDKKMSRDPYLNSGVKAVGYEDIPRDDQAPDSQAPDDQDSVGSRLTQWATNDDQIYCAVGRTANHLPPAAYELVEVRGGGIGFRRFEIDINGLMRLPDTQADNVLNQIEKFWGRTEHYRKYKITQRRGILIAGPTGCGKTCTSKMVCVDVIERNGVVIQFAHPQMLLHGLSLFRKIQPETPVVILIEDIDEVVGDDHSTFLSMLDGLYDQFKRVVFVATTNFPDRLERRITNRPSRFDCVITMRQPVLEARQMYLDAIAPGIELDVFDKERAAKDTDQLSFAHLKELFTAVVILDMAYSDALEKVKKMADEDMPTGDELEYGYRRGSMGIANADSNLTKRRRR